jgi:signal transduction histidine kinase
MYRFLHRIAVMDTVLAEIDFYFRLVWLFSFLIIAIIVFLICIYRLMLRARRSAEESAEYARLVVDAREMERRRIARELHDTVAGGLRRLGFLLYREEASAGGNTGAAEAAAWCDTLIKETRDICQSLYPPDCSRLSFAASLQDLCIRFEKHSGVRCVFSVSPDCDAAVLAALPVETQFQCFRIIQEALTNIEKHAHAGEASLVIRPAEKALLFIVSDDGAGLPAGSGGLGIRGMKDRAKLAGGEFTLESSPEAGVMLTLKVPLPGFDKACAANPLTRRAVEERRPERAPQGA